jgi:hypothetical protein
MGRPGGRGRGGETGKDRVPPARGCGLPSEDAVACEFSIALGQAYFEGGFINPGVEASQHPGDADDPSIVYLGSREERVASFINRRANGNGSVRIIGNNRRIAEWVQAHFQRGDVVQGAVLRSGNILLRMAE